MKQAGAISQLPRLAKERCFGGMGLFVLLLPLVFAGCGTAYSGLDPGEMHPPFTRDVIHPDSVAHLEVAYEDDKVNLKMDRSLNRLRSLWSSGYRYRYGGRFFETLDYRTFATLRSLELSIAELQEMGLEGLSQELAGKMVDEAKKSYYNFVVLDVHVFIGAQYPDAVGRTSLGEAGTRIVLQDAAGNEYKPETIEVGTPRRFYGNTPGDPGAFYRHNTVYFRRNVNGTDILAHADGLELWMRTVQPSAALYFTWDFKEKAVASS